MLHFEIILSPFKIISYEPFCIHFTEPDITLVCIHAHMISMFNKLLTNRTYADRFVTSYLNEITHDRDIDLNLLMLYISLIYTRLRIVFVFVPIPTFECASLIDIEWKHTYTIKNTFSVNACDRIIADRATWNQIDENVLYAHFMHTGKESVIYVTKQTLQTLMHRFNAYSDFLILAQTSYGIDLEYRWNAFVKAFKQVLVVHYYYRNQYECDRQIGVLYDINTV